MSGASDAEVRIPPPPAGQFARNSGFGTIAGLGTAVGSVMTSVILAHTLGVEGTGAVAFALWGVMVAATIADLGGQASLARYLPELAAAGRPREAQRVAALLRRVLLLSSIAAVAGFGLFAFWEWHVTRLSPSMAATWALVGLACGLQTLAGFTSGYLRGVQRFDRLAVLTACSVVLQLACVAVGSIILGIPGALAGYCTGSLLPAMLCLVRSPERRPLSPELRTRLRRYAFYSWAGALASTFVWSRAELFFLQRSSGSGAVGLFTVGVTLANMAAQGPILLTAGLLPYFAESFGKRALDDMREAYATATRVLGFLVLPVCFGLAAVMPTVLPLIYGQAFADAVPSATVLVIAAGIGTTSSVGTSVLLALERSDFIFLSGVLTALLSVCAGFTVIPAFGLMGAAWARCLVQITAVALGSWFIYRRLGFPLPFGGLARLVLAALACAAAARVVITVVPGPRSLAAAVLAGAITYLIAVRMLGALPARDRDRLRALAGMLPSRLGSGFELALELIVRPHPVPGDSGRHAG